MHSNNFYFFIFLLQRKKICGTEYNGLDAKLHRVIQDATVFSIINLEVTFLHDNNIE